MTTNIAIYCLHTVKWFQVSLLDTKTSYLILIIIPGKKISSLVCLIDGALTDVTNQGQSGPESNGNEEVLLIPQTPRLIIRDSLMLYPGN